MEFNEYLAGECVALTMVFITYLCFGLAPVLYVWSYCVIYYTADSDLSIGPVVLAWLVIPVEDIASVIGQGCFANASRIHLQLSSFDHCFHHQNYFENAHSVL